MNAFLSGVLSTVLVIGGAVRASFYSHSFEGKRMANGGTYHADEVTAAHRTLPLGTFVRVTNLQNGRTLLVPITDRGPWHKRFGLDLSEAAAKKLGITHKQGWAWVKIERSTR